MSELWRSAVAARGLLKAISEKVIAETSLGDVKELRQIILRICQENHPIPILVKVTGGLENRFLLDKWYFEDDWAGRYYLNDNDNYHVIEFIVYQTKVPMPRLRKGMSEEELRAFVERMSARRPSRPIIDPRSGRPTLLEDEPIDERVDSDSDVEVLCRIFGKERVKVVHAAQHYIRLQKLHLKPDSYWTATNIVGSALKFFDVQDEFA